MSNTRQVREALVGTGAPAKAPKETATSDGVLTPDPHVAPWGGGGASASSSPLEAVGTSYLDDEDDGKWLCGGWCGAREEQSASRGGMEHSFGRTRAALIALR
jgi:hypothetical protein